MHPTRRLILAAPALLLATRALAEEAVGTTRGLTGSATLTRGAAPKALMPADPLMVGDTVATGAASTAALELFTSTQIQLGPEAQFLIDQFSADLGGVITVGGPMVFDRPDDLPKLDLTVQSAFAQIGVRGTRFFAGPLNGTFSVFVQRGRVSVQAAGESRELGAGDGLDIAAPGAAPGPVGQWKAPRIAAAFALVGLTP